MNPMIKIKVGLITLLISLGLQAQSNVGLSQFSFGDAKIISLVPTPQNNNECLGFKAVYSKPLQNNPNVVVDIEEYFRSAFSAVLEVKAINDTTFEFSLKATVDKACPTLTPESTLTLTTMNGEMKDTIEQTLPSSLVFKPTVSKSGLIQGLQAIKK